MLDADRLKDVIEIPLKEKNGVLEKIYGMKPLIRDEIIEEYLEYGQKLSKHVVDCTRTIHSSAKNKKNILFEGAQGTLLDLDHGTYPFVTSSNPISEGACIGAGVGPTLIDRVIGVAKAYTTRVGESPFPTELQGSINDQLCDRGRNLGQQQGGEDAVGLMELSVNMLFT